MIFWAHNSNARALNAYYLRIPADQVGPYCACSDRQQSPTLCKFRHHRILQAQPILGLTGRTAALVGNGQGLVGPEVSIDTMGGLQTFAAAAN
tara:strand:+ start:1041 stop:1319 length:279 start_codon:yes stop_codon:yes gene_type:complete